MSKAEKFIEERTKRCSNLAHFEDLNGNVWEENTPWLTPDQARRAVEIAREETIKEVLEWLNSHYRDYMYNPTEKQLETFFGMDMIEDLKKTLDNINLNNK